MCYSGCKMENFNGDCTRGKNIIDDQCHCFDIEDAIDYEYEGIEAEYYDYDPYIEQVTRDHDKEWGGVDNG